MKQCDVRPGWHVPGKITGEYGADRTNTVTYVFNSRGYRGEEYNPASKFRICVIGENDGFGVGLNIEDTFGYKLKQHIAASLQLGADDVNLINFSAGGASPDYCVRTLYRQLPDCDVDLVVCQLPPANRTEYYDGRVFRMYAANGVTPSNRDNASIPLVAFCDYYNDLLGRINLVKNVLLVQAFLKERKIDYVIATEDQLFEMTAIDDSTGYLRWLDKGALLLHQYFSCKADRAAGGRNAGRRCHAALAIEILSFAGHRQVERGNHGFGQRMLNYASHLRATDKDWEFCIIHIAKLIAKQERAMT